jgi:hypothetical protein
VATWITDRTYEDVSRVSEISEKGRSGTWSADEQAEWAAGMKGALSYTDYNRIESGIQEVADILNASVSVKIDWDVNGYLTVSDASRWLVNISNIRAKCSGPGRLSDTPSSMNNLTYQIMNLIETILAEVERIANDHLLYCSEPICGGEPYYGIC